MAGCRLVTNAVPPLAFGRVLPTLSSGRLPRAKNCSHTCAEALKTGTVVAFASPCVSCLPLCGQQPCGSRARLWGSFYAGWCRECTRVNTLTFSEEKLNRCLLRVWRHRCTHCLSRLSTPPFVCASLRTPQWTDDDRYCLRGVTNEVHFYAADDFKKGLKLCVADVYLIANASSVVPTYSSRQITHACRNLLPLWQKRICTT